MYFNQRGDISTLKVGPLKLVDKFTYLGSCVSSTENDINTWPAKAWRSIDRLSVIWKSNLTDKIKRSFFQAAAVSILLYGCNTWTLTKRMGEKLDSNYTKILRPGSNTLENSSCTYYPSRKPSQLDEPDMRDMVGEEMDELISDVLLWISSHWRAKVGQPARTYLQQLCTDTRCSLEYLPGAMDDRDGWQEKVKEIHVSSAT